MNVSLHILIGRDRTRWRPSSCLPRQANARSSGEHLLLLQLSVGEKKTAEAAGEDSSPAPAPAPAVTPGPPAPSPVGAPPPHPTLLMLLPPRRPARAGQGILYRLLHLPDQLMCPQPLPRHHPPLLRLRQLLSCLAELGCLVPHLGEEGHFLLVL